MKLNRNQFKKILKECIQELITEGAFSTIKENLQENPTRSAANDFVGHINHQDDNVLDTSFSSVGQMNPSQRLKELAKLTAVHTAKGDSKQATMMENIFMDTAMTTLQQQLGTESSGGGGVYLGEQANSAVEQHDKMELELLNGGRPNNYWAALAFGRHEKK